MQLARLRHRRLRRTCPSRSLAPAVLRQAPTTLSRWFGRGCRQLRSVASTRRRSRLVELPD
eukprot:13003242-Alexandrium_andersonii.AAC.1